MQKNASSLALLVKKDYFWNEFWRAFQSPLNLSGLLTRLCFKAYLPNRFIAGKRAGIMRLLWRKY